METRSSITNAMVPIWIYLAIVLGARFNHRIDHFSRVLPMHVVVSGTMNQQVIAFNPVAPTGWALVIEEPWDSVTSPLLRYSEAGPLVLLPILVFAPMALAKAPSRDMATSPSKP